MATDAFNVSYDFTIAQIDFVVLREPNRDWYVKNITHPLFIIAFAFSGNADYEVDGNCFSATGGDILFFQKNQVHTAHSANDNPWSYCSIAFDIIPFSKAAESYIEKIPILIKSKYSFECARLCSKLNTIWSKQPAGYMLKCRALLSELLFLLISDLESDDTVPYASALNKVINHMVDNVSEDFRIDELAKMANMSPSYFRSNFKKYTGQSPLQYQNQLKINKACDLFKSRSCNVSEAAFTLGFENIYYFSRLFKKMTGLTPSEYIKNN